MKVKLLPWEKFCKLLNKPSDPNKSADLFRFLDPVDMERVLRVAR